MDYYKTAKELYCSKSEPRDEKDKIIIELVKIIDEYKKYDNFLAAHGCFKVDLVFKNSSVTLGVEPRNSIYTDDTLEGDKLLGYQVVKRNCL